MINLKSLNDLDLEAEMKRAVECETKASVYVLHVLAEVERRRLYSKTSPSLFEYCVTVLKYRGGAAQRRIDSMRAMKIIPEIEPKIVSGELCMTSVSQAQSFFRHEAKVGKKMSLNEKRDLLIKLENKSTREVVKELVSLSPQFVPQEKRRELTTDKTEIKLVLEKELIEKLDKIKALLSHKYPHLTDRDLINELADIALKKLDPLQSERKVSADPNSLLVNANEAASLPAQEVNSKHIPKSLRRAVYQKYNSKCSYPGCNSRYFLEFDHVTPRAFGGKTIFENLRLLCRTHNQKAAIEAFGIKHMQKFLPVT